MDYFTNKFSTPIVATPIEELDVDAIVVGVNDNLTSPPKSAFARLKESIGSLVDFNGKEKDVFVVYNVKGVKAPRVVLVGLGSEKCSSEVVRNGAGKAIRALRDKDVKRVAVESIGSKPHETAEGCLLGVYKFDELKTAPKKHFSELTFVTSSESEKEEFNQGLVFAKSQNVARRLAELPANIATPSFFCQEATKLFQENPKVKVIEHDVEWAKSKNMGSFLSVTHGSDEPAKFLEIHYNGASSSDAPIVFVGKGVTFDSGGISLKPSEGMGSMRGDCGGAASVISATLGISKLNLPVNIICLTPFTENLPSGKATKPGDVVTASNGKTIEIDNTDAEGRLILADALVYADTFNPHTVIDVATLTGAIGVALGQHYSGAFTNSDDLWNEINKAGNETWERFWRMPMGSEYRKQMDSELADIKNVGGRHGGSCTAASFLNEFTKAERWIHLDVAGTALPGSRDSGYVPSGMTGFPTRALIQFVRNLSKK